MRKYFIAVLFAALICVSLAAHADVTVKNDHISAYLDSSGGIVLTGYEDRINTTDAADLVSIDASRVVFLAKTDVQDVYDVKVVNIVSHAEATLVEGVRMANGSDGAGVYYVPAADPTAVDYIKFSGATSEIYSSEESVSNLQTSTYGLLIGFESDAGAMVYDPITGTIEAFSNVTGSDRQTLGSADLVLTDDGALYLDDPAQRVQQLIATDVDQYAGIDGYVYYIRDVNGERQLTQYAPQTLSWQNIALPGGSPESVTASYDTALVMDDGGTVYSIDNETATVSPFTQVTLPESDGMTDVFLRGMSGQLNVYSRPEAQAQDILVFDFSMDGNGDTSAVQDNSTLNLLASASLDSEQTTKDILTPAAEYSTLSYGSRGDAVKNLQQALTDLDYLDDRVDGIYGPKTRYAVKLYQDFNGLEVTGIADKDLQKELLDGNPPTYDPYRQISYWARGLRVQDMQKRLRELGYMADPADGIYGPYTRDGVSLFQAENGLDETGIADSDTLEALYNPKADTCSSYFLMNYGDSGWRVLQLNKRLSELYYLEGKPGNTYNSATKKAVKLFQEELDAVQSGIASAGLQEKLFS
jgi:peptidoglycan hydrolase-like protein with peptidoglycan-binding domain